MTRALLFLAYYLVFTPISLAIRLPHDPLARRWHPDRPSYWIHGDRTPSPGGRTAT